MSNIVPTETSWGVIDSLFNFASGNTSASAALQGSYSGAALKTLFFYFNSGIILAAASVYAFILIIGTINTARDGAFLGKKWDSYWIPLRVIMGSACAVPLKSGFCLAQYFIFLMVGVSISFANGVWQHFNDDIQNKSVPPVVSSDISDGVKNDLAVYMLAKFARDNLPSDPQNTLINMSTDADQTSLIQAGKLIEAALAYTPGVGLFKNNPDDGQPNSTVQHIASGMQSWSVINSDNKYDQYYIDKILWQYSMSLPNNSTSISQLRTKLISALSKYDGQDSSGCSSSLQGAIVDVDPDNIRTSVMNPKPSCGYYPLEALVVNVMSGLQSQLSQDAKNAQDSASNGSTESDDTSSDWWNAGQKYFDVDQSYSKTMNAFASNFNSFDGLLNVENSGLITLKKQKVSIKYYERDHTFSVLADLYNQNDLHYTPKPTQSTETLKTSDKLDIEKVAAEDKQSDQYVTVDMSTLRADLAKVLSSSTDNNSCKNLAGILPGTFSKQSCTESVDQIIPASISTDIGMYFMVIDTLVNSSGDTITLSDGNTITKLKLVQNFLSLIYFLQLNNVAFAQSSAVVSDLSAPAETALNTIFKNIDPDGSLDSGVFSEIYNIGSSTDGSVVSQSYSMLNQIQSVGQAIIQMTLNALQQVSKSVHDSAQSQITNLAVTTGVVGAAALAEAAASYFVPGLPAATIGVGNFALQLQSMQWMFKLSMQLMWLPLLFFVLMTLFGIAIMFTLMVPMAPFILFWAGKLAWLLLMLEALVAAPIVALGIVYPEGHEVFGKAEPGIQIMLNLVLRPVLMIFGLLAGLTLTYIVIKFSATGFHAIATQIDYYSGLSASSDSHVSEVLSILLVFMYGTFITLAFYKCFSLIYVLPDKVLHWIGGSRSENAGADELQQMKSASAQNAQGMGQAGTQAVEKSNQANQQHAQSMQNTGQSALQMAGGLKNTAKVEEKGQNHNQAKLSKGNN